jgi:DNA-directed RNA polymerase II subunit RPB7
LKREDRLQLHPKFFGKKIAQHITEQLRLQVEGKCTGRFGWTIAVANVEDLSRGLLDQESGYAHYDVKYNALVFNPFVNEVLPAVVTSITAQGIFVNAGPCEMMIFQTYIPETYQYYDPPDGMPCYIARYENEPDSRIEVDTSIRVRVVTIKRAADKITVLAAIDADYLGPSNQE